MGQVYLAQCSISDTYKRCQSVIFLFMTTFVDSMIHNQLFLYQSVKNYFARNSPLG